MTVTQAPAPFGILVTRRSTGAVLFDTRVGVSGATPVNGLVFEDQYLEWSTQLPASAADGGVHLFGLAEHITPFQLEYNGTAGQIYTLQARDQGTPVHNPGGNTNLYASMPFYMVMDPATGAVRCGAVRCGSPATLAACLRACDSRRYSLRAHAQARPSACGCSTATRWTCWYSPTR